MLRAAVHLVGHHPPLLRFFRDAVLWYGHVLGLGLAAIPGIRWDTL